MLVTINTDASFHPEYKVGAFAFWVVCNEFRIQKAGYLRSLCKNPDEAEMNCIINALHQTLSNKVVFSKVIINTDSLNSIAIFKNDREHIKKYNLFNWKNKRKLFNKIRHDYNSKNSIFQGIEIEFRHVKAHSNISNKRSYVNEWCDTNAKRFLWKRIHQLKLIKK